VKLPLCQINAFSQRFNGGNPAGVCPLPEWLSDADMQAIAKENDYSETAFFVQDGEDYALRWFTPSCEIDLCGHATVATAHWLATESDDSRPRYRFHTRSGLLTVTREAGRYLLDMPTNQLEVAELPATLAGMFDTEPSECLRADDFLLVFEDPATVTTFEADFGQLQTLKARGLIITAPAEEPGLDYIYRWFGGENTGIDEDPATGSAQCSLMPYWSQRLGRSSLSSKQCSERIGEFDCRLQGDRVEAAGYAVTYLRGEILLG